MNIFKRYTNLLVCSAGFLGAAVLAGCGGNSGSEQGRDPVLGIPAASLISVAVTPATASIAIGASQQFTATAVYSDGSARDVTANAQWASSAPEIATVNTATGTATGVNAGATVIGASFNGKAGSANLTVLAAKLLSVAVAPAVSSLNVGNTLQYVAMGTFDNNTTRDITAVSVFASASPAVATIAAAGGMATAHAPGSSVISATSGVLSGTATLNVQPAALMALSVSPATSTLQIGASGQLKVLAAYSDGSSVDVTASSAFDSATPAAVSVAGTGRITGIAAGSSYITANFGGKSASALATTIAATLSSISVTPANATVSPGGTQQFVAIGTYSDNSSGVITNSAQWTSSSTNVATVLDNGIASGIAAGNTTITATKDGKSASASLTVSSLPPPLPSASVNLGSAASFAVLAGTALTNNAGGTTLITGDVGSPSQTTDPVLAAGFTNYKSGAILENALADLQVAITDANSRTCDVTFAGDIDLGGLVLAPGVYCYAGAINITGTLKLNGPGVYIFRTAQTLNTASNSIVELTNGATANDVTWVPVGPTTLGANGAFIGSILGQSAAITVGDGTTLLNGRVLSAAAVTLRNNKITK